MPMSTFMPKVLEDFLVNLSDEDAIQVAAFIAGEMTADDRILAVIETTHPQIDF